MKREPTVHKPASDVPEAPNDETWEEIPAGDADEPADDSDLDESSDLDSYELVDIDEKHWEVFIQDDDESDATPDYGDFWMPD